MTKFVLIGCMLLGIFCVSLSIGKKGNTSSGYGLVKKMIETTKQISTITYQIQKTERIDEKMITQKAVIKLNRYPFNLYLKQLSPNNGLEVLYLSNKNNNKAIINTNGFPWFNLKLNPYGSSMRKNQHHVIFDIGYGLVATILEYLVDKYGEEGKTFFKNKGSVVWKANICWEIELYNPYFKYIPYTVKKGETLVSIAGKFKISDYMILQNNKEIEDYDDIKEGQTITIPNDYSHKLILYIEQQQMIPVMIKVYDDKGLYEQYEYSNIFINKIFKPEEFTEEYEEYNF